MVGAGTFAPTAYVTGELNSQVMVRLLEPLELVPAELLELMPVELLELVPAELLELVPAELLELVPVELLLAAVTATVPQRTSCCLTEPQVAVTLMV